MQCFHTGYEGRNNCSKTIFLQFFLALKTNKKFFLSISFNFCDILKTKTDLFVLSIKHFLIFKNFNYHINFYLLFQFSCLWNRLKRLKLRGWYIYIYSSYYFENVFLECGYIKLYLFQLHCLLI